MKMKKILLLSVLVFLVTGDSGTSSILGHPNVLLIIVDDLRPSLGCYGDTLALTPNIDALANNGVIFTQAFAQQALCGPSRTSFLTSRRPDTTKLYDVHSYWRHHAGNFTTLPQYFKQHGYHTVSAGKVFHPGIVSNHSDDQPYSWSEEPFHPPSHAHKQDPVCLGRDGALHTNIYCPVHVAQQPGETLPDIETTHFAKSWLHRRRAAQQEDALVNRASQPFFMAVGYHKPHIPLKFPVQFLDFYPISEVPLAVNDRLPHGLPSVAWNPWNDLRRRDDIMSLNVTFPYGPLPDFYARYIRQGYYAATTYVDALIGDLLAAVSTLFPDTVVALVGDHGWSLGEHQEWSKFSNFEVATRVPFIISRQFSQVGNPLHYYSSFFSESSVSGTNSIFNQSRLFQQPYDEYPNKYYEEMNKDENYKEFSRHWNKNGRKLFKASKEQNKFSLSNSLVELVDLFPTLVDLAGIPAISTCPSESRDIEVCTEGASLAPILNAVQNSMSARYSHKRKSDQLLGHLLTGQKTNIFPQISDPERIEGVKKAVFSQYPRPGLEPSRFPDSDQPRTVETTVMGYSMRTRRYRYTAWLRFNNETFKPDFSQVLAEELYDHVNDPEENFNVCDKNIYKRKKQSLYRQLVSGWEQSLVT